MIWIVEVYLTEMFAVEAILTGTFLKAGGVVEGRNRFEMVDLLLLGMVAANNSTRQCSRLVSLMVSGVD